MTGAVWLNVLAGSVATLIWATVRRRVGPIPCGPWLPWRLAGSTPE